MSRCKAREALEVRRTFGVRRNASRLKRNAADVPFVKSFGFYRKGMLLITCAPPYRNALPVNSPIYKKQKGLTLSGQSLDLIGRGEWI